MSDVTHILQAAHKGEPKAAEALVGYCDVLEKLATHDKLMAQLVELRCSLGMTREEAAEHPPLSLDSDHPETPEAAPRVQNH